MTTKSIGARRGSAAGPARNEVVRGANRAGNGATRRGFLLIPIAIALAWFALSPAARAVSPAPDGGYPGGNTAEGDGALNSLSTGVDNTATGNAALFRNTIGGDNTATGSGALFLNTTGSNNTATGFDALGGSPVINTTGSNNTATGAFAGGSLAGDNNTATGFRALESNEDGSFNTATGVDALFSNTAGSFNTATGVGALRGSFTGNGSTATGYFALSNNTAGGDNMAIGIQALLSNTTGGRNTAVGSDTLISNKTGSNNIALGDSAGLKLTTGNNDIDIGNLGVGGESNTIRLGTVGTQTAAFIAGIRGATVPGGIGVVVGADGHLGTAISSARFKEAIKPMGKASEAILALKPVTFRYKHKLDPERIPQFGLVAEQVEKVNPDLVARDDQGKVNSVRYEAVNAMLLNEFLKEHREFLKEHRKVQELEASIAQQQKEIKALAATVKEQTLQIGKVRAASLR